MPNSLNNKSMAYELRTHYNKYHYLCVKKLVIESKETYNLPE